MRTGSVYSPENRSRMSVSRSMFSPRSILKREASILLRPSGRAGWRATHDLFLDKNGPGTHYEAGAIRGPPQGTGQFWGVRFGLVRDAAPFPLRKGISLNARRPLQRRRDVRAP